MRRNQQRKLRLSSQKGRKKKYKTSVISWRLSQKSISRRRENKINCVKYHLRQNKMKTEN